MIDKDKIAIVTTVANFELYKKTATLFPKGIDRIVIDGTRGMYGIDSINYMFQQFKSKHYDWIIMADEDVFFYDAEKVFDLIAYMDEYDYDIAGVRDGGVIQHRSFNPMVFNTFFSVLNFKKIANLYDHKQVLQTENPSEDWYSSVLNLGLPYQYDISTMKEPYYCFYFWLHKKEFKFLFLPTVNPVEHDEVANTILMPDGGKIALHSWYARAYNVYEDQTIRLNSFIQEFNINSEIDLKEVWIIKRRFFNFYKNFKKDIRKIISK